LFSVSTQDGLFCPELSEPDGPEFKRPRRFLALAVWTRYVAIERAACQAKCACFNDSRTSGSRPESRRQYGKLMLSLVIPEGPVKIRKPLAQRSCQAFPVAMKRWMNPILIPALVFVSAILSGCLGERHEYNVPAAEIGLWSESAAAADEAGRPRYLGSRATLPATGTLPARGTLPGHGTLPARGTLPLPGRATLPLRGTLPR
jgi:hypothetical protein